MYTARYSDGETTIVQTVLSFETVVFDSADQPTSWTAQFRKAIDALVSTPDVDFSLRIDLHDKQLKRELFISTSQDHAEQLEMLAARFLRLNSLVEESVKLCANQAQHDALVGGFPKLHSWLRSRDHVHDDCQLICDFRLFPLLEHLFDQALQRSWDFSVQFNARRYLSTADDVRALRKNLAHIDAARDFPSPLRDLQHRMVNRLDRTRFLVDEFVGFGTPDVRVVLGNQIVEEFAATFGRFGFPAALLPDSHNVSEQLATGFHSSLFDDAKPTDKAACAATPEEIQALLSWKPAETSVGSLLLNTHVGHEHEQDFLKRIEVKLEDLERVLQSRNLALDECAEFKKALGISRADPPFALVKTRQILEGIVQRVYQDRKEGQPIKPLYNMIDELLDDGRVFPRRIASYLHTLRVLGNLVAHGGPARAQDAGGNELSESDVELTLLMTLNLVEWYLSEYKA
ncbi:MAG TPA: DUF4145 domain-containing protein [Pyrinomonadaceae bacterium]|nr:DUF4145 domain-containing protein [Pyrinomonadaceae bacterium]